MGGIGGMGIARFAYGCQIILRRKNSTAALSQHHSSAISSGRSSKCMPSAWNHLAP